MSKKALPASREVSTGCFVARSEELVPGTLHVWHRYPDGGAVFPSQGGGWIYVSAGWNARMNLPFPVPTLWFGLFQWPHLPGLAEASEATRARTAASAITVHAWLAWGAIVLVARADLPRSELPAWKL